MRREELKKGLIVSCQATAEEPMRGSETMGRFALAAPDVFSGRRRLAGQQP
ncbi:putative N-acetylmannosamine-6-phosphate 2-epimerase 1 [Blautia hydrogenotrophica CAG:147]|uniref:N-acetylmannosamine-6-phosphate 2-epimerase 1 n=1 Tax=Blautia hydrogenotrophica TaxID=53443 RepID=UPI000336753D|nr:N-acetylmannosamine-6-phosphate 2-epimerase 1 [Blautia hydrogenotrophica]CCX57695.1 putative N-acetylmannosamine-6-phosphate 2-epimerase 1 [Blautia hydrogenotrophica CAG:147]